MKNSQRFWRSLLFVTLLAAVCASSVLPFVNMAANAAPLQAQTPPHVVISEFRAHGASGADDEFVEIYNATGNSVNITNWKVKKSSGCGSTVTDLVTIGNVTLLPGQYYLIGRAGGYTGTVDQTFSSSIADDGGVALFDSLANIIDQVGMCSSTTYKEFDAASPAYLAPLTSSSDQSYERKTTGYISNCIDTDNNVADFILNASSSNPQTSSSNPLVCLVVTNVTSPNSDALPYAAGATIDIRVTFSSMVNVTGTPTLLLETGVTHRTAGYVSGSGSDTLTFRYTVVAGDTSGDLDYVAINSLTLNGGSITGAIGDAILTLPSPGSAGSLGANKNLIIDNGVAPSLVSFTRQNPTSTQTNATSLTFRATFSETVTNVDVTDFAVNGNIATTNINVNGISPSVTSSNYYDVTISGSDLANYNGAIGLDLRLPTDITDISGNALSPTTEPTVDEVYTVDHSIPSVTINQGSGQADPTSTTPVKFEVIFSEPINVSTFTVSDVTQTGANFVTWSITDSGNHTNFTLSATSVGQNGALSPSIVAGRVQDLAGNLNTASTSTDNTVTFNDNVRPTVTVNQASAQADPASTFPINFAVVFSEPINVSVFTTSDITQGGTATGVTWKIIDAGDHKNFTLSATAVTASGTLIPSLSANRVTDMVGNNNLASTSSDNTVTYSTAPPVGFHSVIINEIAWSGTKASEDDEWIELYNTTSSPIDLTGWTLKSDDNTPTIVLDGHSIAAKGYFLLARKTGTFKDLTPNLVYGETGAATAHTLVNGGEILRLKNGNTEIDVANYYNGFGFAKWAAGSGTPNYASMERSSFSLNSPAEWFTYASTPLSTDPHDRNGNLINGTPGKSNWAITVVATPSKTPTVVSNPTKIRTATPIPAPPPQLLVINEFVPRPGHDWNQDGDVNVKDEYIEILNHGTVDVPLSGYSLDDEVNIGSDPYRLPSLTLKPGERVVFYGSETHLLLGDGGDGVRLLKPNGQLMDAYNYFVVGYPDQAFCRLPDNGGADDWNQYCFPTPGLQNSLSGIFNPSPGIVEGEPLCPIADTLPGDFIFAECPGFGYGIWRAEFWDKVGWLGEKILPEIEGKWPVFAD